MRYLQGTTDMGLFYSKESEPELIGYANVGYLSNPYKARSQTRYVLTYSKTAISWRSVKQTLTAISSNHYVTSCFGITHVWQMSHSLLP